MKRYYFQLSGTTVAARYIFETTAAPTGLTEVTEAQFKEAFDVTRVFTLSGGVMGVSGDRDYVLDGVDTSPDIIGRPDSSLD